MVIKMGRHYIDSISLKYLISLNLDLGRWHPNEVVFGSWIKPSFSFLCDTQSFHSIDIGFRNILNIFLK